MAAAFGDDSAAALGDGSAAAFGDGSTAGIGCCVGVSEVVVEEAEEAAVKVAARQ